MERQHPPPPPHRQLCLPPARSSLLPAPRSSLGCRAALGCRCPSLSRPSELSLPWPRACGCCGLCWAWRECAPTLSPPDCGQMHGDGSGPGEQFAQLSRIPESSPASVTFNQSAWAVPGGEERRGPAWPQVEPWGASHPALHSERSGAGWFLLLNANPQLCPNEAIQVRHVEASNCRGGARENPLKLVFHKRARRLRGVHRGDGEEAGS